MSRLCFGLLAGVSFGALAVLSMLRLSFPDRRAALTAAFIDRFGIGLVIGLVNVGWPGWLTGLLFGLLLSAPSAIITKAWPPIMIFGGVGGLIIGVLVRYAVH